MATHAIQIDFLLAGLRDPDDGLPLNGGSVEFYEVGTSTPKNVWTETAKTNAYTSYTLDSNGVAELYGDGSYKIIVKDSSGATEYTFDEVKLSSYQFNARTVTSATVSVTSDDDAIYGDTSGNSITLNLETYANFTRPLKIAKTSASNNLVIDPNGAETIGGSSTITLTENGESVTLIPDADAGMWRKLDALASGIVAGTQSLASLDVTGAATIGSTLMVTGLTTMNGGFAGASGAVSGTFSASGAVSLLSTLDIGSGTTKRVAPSGTFADNSNGNPNISDTVFDSGWIGSGTETWESFGATGSGADNVWTALDSLPGDVDWIEVKLIARPNPLSSGYAAWEAYISARKYGSSQAIGKDNAIGYSHNTSDSSIYIDEAIMTPGNRIPVVAPSGGGPLFDIGTKYDWTNYRYYLILTGYGFNP